MCQSRSIDKYFMCFLLLASNAAIAFSSDPISLRPMRDTLLRLTVEQSADVPAAGLATMVKAIAAADKELSENDKRHLTIIRGSAELRMGNSDLAESLFEQALMIDENDYLTIWLRGRCKEGTQRFDSAIEDFQKSLEIKPDFSAAMLSLAAIYVEKENYDEAARWLEQIDMLDEHGDERWEYFVRSVLALKLRKFSDAVKFADASLSGGDRFLFVPMDKIFATKAIGHFSSGQLADAKESLRQVLSLQPSNQHALQMMWTIHNQAGDHLAAYLFAKHLVKEDEHNEKFHSLEMKSLIRLRQFAAAEKVATQMLQINPENAEAMTLLEKLAAAKKRPAVTPPPKEPDSAQQPQPTGSEKKTPATSNPQP